MVGWTWKRTQIQPADILTAAHSLSPDENILQADLLEGLNPAEKYLEWAKHCLQRADEFGLDSAVCYAKRAACRVIDGLVSTNHLQYRANNTYPDKMELLTKAGVSVPGIVHDLIIDPRNSIEHEYTSPSEQQAKHAVELADLFLAAIREEGRKPANISYGYAPIWERPDPPTNVVKHRTPDSEFSIYKQDDPVLLVDVSQPDPPVLVLIPKDEELLWCNLQDFDTAETLSLVALLRSSLADTGNVRTRVTLNSQAITRLHDQLKL